MAASTWTPATIASGASWSKNKALSDLQAAAPNYNSALITYDSPIVYYNGYNPTTTTPEGERGASWAKVAE